MRQVAPICTQYAPHTVYWPHTNQCPNGILIGSAVSVWLTAVAISHRHTGRGTCYVCRIYAMHAMRPKTAIISFPIKQALFDLEEVGGSRFSRTQAIYKFCQPFTADFFE